MNHIQHWGYWSFEFFLVHAALEHPVSRNAWIQAGFILLLLAAGLVYARFAGGWMTDRYNSLPTYWRNGFTRMALGLALCLPAAAISVAVGLLAR